MPGGKKWPDLSPQKRVLLRSQIPVNEKSLEHGLSGRVEFQATLYSRNLVRREPGKVIRLPKSYRISNENSR